MKTHHRAIRQIRRASLVVLISGLAFATIAALIVFSGLKPPSFQRELDTADYGPPVPVLQIVDYDDLPGWERDNVAAAFPAFLRSCTAMQAKLPTARANPLENPGAEYDGPSIAGTAGDWAQACRVAGDMKREQYSDDIVWAGAVRQFFRDQFLPVRILEKRAPLGASGVKGGHPRIGDTGIFTGYFEPLYPARREPEGVYQTPLLSRPDDLVDVDLGAFNSDFAGERISGKLIGARLQPYDDRRAINNGALNGRAKTLAYLDPNDLFFLQIQGSGRLQFPNGETMRVGYDGANGHAYTAIGRVLVQRGDLALEKTSMQTIREWLNLAGPEAAESLRETNASYVFFRELEPAPEGLGPPGAQGVALTPERSLAVDRRFHPLGAPVFVEIDGFEGVAPIRKLMIAQDTGGAIRGPIRGDFFWGAGDLAGAKAGKMNASGRFFLLLPRAHAEKIARETGVR
ncbi:MAG: MltA domain-containing protein [Pseudomonadota bacterium]